MKKHFTSTIVLSLLFIAIGNAQTLFGVKGGLNFATLSKDGEYNPDGLTSFHVGGMAEVFVADKFYIQPELLLSFQGAKESYDEFEEKLKLTYLNIPIMAKLYLTDALNIQAGPQIGFLIDSKSTLEGEGTSVETDIDRYTKDFDFGLNIGLGYKLSNGFNVSARYNFGLTDVTDSNEEDFSNDFSFKNRVFQLSIGYFF